MPDALLAEKSVITAPAEAGYAEERRESLLKLAITSLQLGRQNLQDTQLSCDARVIGFYEAIALGLREPKGTNASSGSSSPIGSGDDAATSVNDQLKLFALASSLAYKEVDPSDKDATVAHKIVGLEAICNSATLYQRRALQGQLEKGKLELKKTGQADLSKAVELYQEVLGKSETGSTPTSDKSRLELTAELGLLVCKYAAWCEETSGGLGEALKAQDAVATVNNLREKLKSAKKLVEDSLDVGDPGSASSQIIRQTETFLDKVMKALPPQVNSVPASVP